MVLHERTRSELDAFVLRPAHAVALVAEDGMGKSFIAEHLARRILGLEQDASAAYPYMYFVRPDETGKIKIEAAWELLSLLKLKTTGTAELRRVVIIEHADTMTSDAQNALLKAIEEPPEDTVMILTVHNRTSILPTIVSRVQFIHVHAPAKNDLQAFFAPKDQKSFDKVYFMSGGRPGLLHALLADEKDHPLVQTIEEAKHLINADIYERLSAVDDIVKRKHSQAVAQALLQYALTGIEFSTTPDKAATLKRLTALAALSNSATEQLGGNAQAKLVLTNLFVHM